MHKGALVGKFDLLKVCVGGGRLTMEGFQMLFYVKDSISCAQIHLSHVDDLECIVLKLNLSTQMSLIFITDHHPQKVFFTINLNALLKECDTKN